MNKILSVFVSLEDQLHQISQHSENLSLSDQKVLRRHSMSRYHTSLGRMSSLIALKQQPDPVALAEQGFINVHDGGHTRGFRYYQMNQVLMEDPTQLYPGMEQSELKMVLDNQFRGDLMRSGLPTWNVSLSKSLNAQPPKTCIDILGQPA